MRRCSGWAAVAVALFWTGTAFGHSSGGNPPDLPKSGAVQKTLPTSPGFMNFESAHVHPLDINPSGTMLAVCNTPDARVELFAIDGGTGALTHTGVVTVGYDPVSARFRSDTELWVVNLISDSISIVDVTTGHVVATIQTDDEPADVVFFTDSGNSDALAAVSCSRVDTIQIFDADTLALVDTLPVLGEDPRALTTNGSAVYGAIFNSGNSTTIIGHVEASALEDVTNPYGGFNPPFNDGVPGTSWVTPHGSTDPGDLTSQGKPQPPLTGMIVRKDYSDLALDGLPKWKDDNGADWTEFVRGAKANTTRRLPGWDVIDNDTLKFDVSSGTSALDTGFGEDGYVVNQMNICMALAINPANGTVAMVGTDATNEIRFEPVINGTFTRVLLSIMNGTNGNNVALVDLNEAHLDAAQGGAGQAYEDSTVPQPERNKSIGDPRGIAFDPTGARMYITGMGSNNVIVVDASTGARLGGLGHTINVGTGPTGAAHHNTLDRLYVVNKFSSTVSVINTSTVGAETVAQTAAFYDPTPEFINEGREHFYDTHKNSGLGQISCASCHIDGAMDRLAWDLGDPLGEMKETTTVNLGSPGPGEHNLSFTPESEFDDFHFMKGPMTTQTLQDIIGKEPHHWRGDRDGIEEFAGAFSGLQGRDAPLDATSMQEFENFLSSIFFGPNPFRALDNSLAGGPKLFGTGTNPLMSMDGHFTSGRFDPPGFQLPDGDAWRGFQLYVDGDPDAIFPDQPPLDSSFNCVTCHSLPTGAGSLDIFPGGSGPFTPIPPGPNGERHMALVSVDGTGEKAFKTAQLRNQLDKVGFYVVPDPGNGGQPRLSRAGFGVVHDGSVAGLDEFLSSDVFQMKDDQDVADLVAFSLSVNGGDFEDLMGLPGGPLGFPAGVPGVRDPGPEGGENHGAHAAIGKQVTITSSTPSAGDMDLINLFIDMADAGVIDLIAKGELGGVQRGWFRGEDATKAVGTFQSDLPDQTHSIGALLNFADAGAGVTFTAVPAGSGMRMGIDRDEDTHFDYYEILHGSNPADPNSLAQTMPATSRTGWWITALLMIAATLAAGYVSTRRVRRTA